MRGFMMMAASLLLASSGAAAWGQTVTKVPTDCTATGPFASDPAGLFVEGPLQYQYAYSNYVVQTFPTQQLLPPQAKGGCWGFNQFGDGLENSLIPAPGQSFFATNMAGGQCAGNTDTGEACTGNVEQLMPFGTSGVPTVLHSFTGPSAPDGDTPTSIAQSRDGALLGGTAEGGPNHGGTVYRLTPPAGGGIPWNETVLHAFGGSQGSVPVVWVVGRDGSIYGTTEPAFDGSVNASVWRLAQVGQTWTLTVLHRFTDYPKSALSPLVSGPDGSLYGTVGVPVTYSPGYTTYNRELHGGRSLFRLTPPATGQTGWTYKVVYNFPVPVNTASNLSIVTTDGSIYGYTSYYSSPCKSGSCGRIWQLTPPRATATQYQSAALYDFTLDPATNYENAISFVHLGFRHDAEGVGIYALPVGYGFSALRISERGWK